MSDANKKSDNSFLLQGSILAIASIISRIVGLLYRIPLTDIIGKQGNDYYGTAFEIYNIILIISSYSIPLAVSKLVSARMAKGQAKNAYKVLIGSLIFAGISGALATTIVYVGADFFTGTLLKTPYAIIALKVLAPTLFVVAIVGVFRGFFQGLHTMMPSAISQIAEQIINAIVSVVAAYLLFSYGAKVGAVLGDEESYAAAYGAAGGTLGTLSGAVTALLFVLFVYFVFSRSFKKRRMRDHSRKNESYRDIMYVLIITIIPVLMSTTLYNISSIIDQGIFKNIANIQGYSKKEISEWWGVFTGQYKVLINVPISIASAMAASSVPALTAAFNKGDRSVVKKQVHAAYRFIMIIAFPCAVGIAVLSKPIMLLLFKDGDKTSYMMLIVGAVSIIFYSISTLSNGILQGLDKMRIPVRNAAIALVLHVIFLFICMEFFYLNIYAVVLANAFYAFLMCILNGIAVKKYSGNVQDVFSTYILPGACSGIMGVIVFFAYKGIYAVIRSNAIATIVSMLLGVIVYFITMIVTNGIQESDLRRFPKGQYLVKIAKKFRLL